MDKAFLLTCALVAAAAAPALAQSKFTATALRSDTTRAEAIISAQAARLASLTQAAQDLTADLAAVQAELDKRTTCENAGRIFINGHATADAQGCVDPANF